MSKMKKCKVVMLPTNEKAYTELIFRENRLMYQSKKSFKNDRKWSETKHFHLYILSDEEIKECKVVMLPTNDKKAIIYKHIEKNSLSLNPVYKEWYKLPQNLYILSDEEIKEGDWFALDMSHSSTLPDEIHQMGSDNWSKTGGIHFCEGNSWIKSCKKIILTTDPILIADGVQPIDDEFLQWFVKNPNCESVEVIIEYKDGYGNWYKYDKEFWDKHGNKPKFGTRYKIIIPKEEPKQEIVGYGLHLFMKRYNE